MTGVEVFVDPSCPWAWITSRWLKEVAPQRGLDLTWKSFCIEIRDDYGLQPTIPEHLREFAATSHAIAHRLLRIFEAARASAGEEAVDALYTEWGRRFFTDHPRADESLVAEALGASGLDSGLLEAGEDDAWDTAIVTAMETAYEFGGTKSQTPVVVVRSDPPHGFKGPVMSPAPTGEGAVRLWDALAIVSREPGFFEITRPRTNPPRPPSLPMTSHGARHR